MDEANRKMENAYVRVIFDENYNISSIFDKVSGHEAVKEGEVANRLTAFEDIPREWDAWEITNYYTEKYWNLDEVSSVQVIRDGETAGFEIVRLYDAYNTRGKVKVSFGFDVAKVEITSILEKAEEEIPVTDNTVTLPVKPFEIVTLKVTRKI